MNIFRTNRRLLVCVLLLLCLATTAAIYKLTINAQRAQPNEPKVTVQQLQTEGGAIPVEIQRPQANFKTQNSVENISFVVRNNTNKNITAICLAYSIQIERDKVESKDTFFHTVDSFVHKDIREGNGLKPVAPGQEEVFAESGETVFESGSIVKGVVAKIDYVEFEDGTILGANENGGRIISLMRDGATKYKNWLVQQYIENKKSVNTVVALLQANDLPIELKFNSQHQNLGAKLYRRYMRRIYETQGISKLEDIVNK
jgi:hypothetical protein